MTLHRFPLIVALGAGLAVASAFSAGTLHGIRNPKCAADEAEAKTAVFEKLGSDKKLCEDGSPGTQSGGWSCHSGGECPKGKFRCNTQYVCGSVAPTPTAEPSMTLSMPSPVPSTNSAPLPKGRAALPDARPTVSPTKTDEAPYTGKSKREIKDGATSYVEERTTDEKGNVSTVVRPKTAKDTDIPPPAAVPSPTPAPSAKPKLSPAEQAASTLVNPAAKAMEERVKTLEGL